jgi:gamma-glutamylcyclotransferase (GGCT)/AIG2-like uncharacterized protein YtfP
MTVEHLPLFVFGTLRRGQPNHDRLAGCFLRMTPARLPGFGKRHPLMIVRRAGDAVEGEACFVRPDAWDRTIRACDDLEGIPPGTARGPEYRRIKVQVETSDGPLVAWAYVHPETMPDSRLEAAE